MKIVSIIPARGGSKGIPKKNLISFCGKPLIYWSITQSLNASFIDETFVSSDSSSILSVSSSFGASSIKRPDELSTDNASSESALIHALDEIEKDGVVDVVVFLQPTSPIRHPLDIQFAIKSFLEEKYDSLFSACELEDFLIWQKNEDGFESFNYDYKSRKRRQDRSAQYLENGSFYIFKPEVLRKNNNRLGGKIGVYTMPMWKGFEIDKPEDIEICEMFMKNKILNQ